MSRLIIRSNTYSKEICFEPPVSLKDLMEENGIYLSHPCGGRGVCGRCRAQLVTTGEEILTCQYVLQGDTEIFIPDNKLEMGVEISLSEGAGTGHNGESNDDGDGCSYGIAVDIGTTTIAAALVELGSGEVLATEGMTNPQTNIGADVISRISAAMDGKDVLLQQQVRTALSQLGQALFKKKGIASLSDIPWVVTGNTTMLYLLMGEDPEPLSHAPFKADDLFGRWVSIPEVSERVYLPSCMDAFVGADITCAVYSSGMTRREKKGPVLLCDAGTNGEVALYKDGTLYVTSTAAGPAFESVGVFGSVLIDALARSLDDGSMDETGLIDEDLDGVLPIDEENSLTQKDIRTVQLAKAAIRAGIETVLSELKVPVDQVECLYLAGGFGAHLDLSSAVRIGLIPEGLKDRTEVIGNASLKGAYMLLTEEKGIEEEERLAGLSQHVDLGGNPLFNELYIDNMYFE